VTWDELVAAHEASGKTQKELQDFLGLSNVSTWATGFEPVLSP